MLTVSIVLHKTKPALLRSVMQSLEHEPVDKIYLVDNSPDASLRSEAANYPRTIYTHIPNRGFGNAHNTAIRQAAVDGSTAHLVLNPDVRWDNPILGKLLSILADRPHVALIHPRVSYPDGKLQHTCRLLPTPFDVFARRFLPRFIFRKRRQRYLLPDSAYDHEFNPVYIQGSFMFFRMKPLLQSGLFDERFFMYPEDIDLTRRIRENHDTLYCPDVTVIHDHAAESTRFGKMLWIHIVNMIRYFNKWGWFHDPERRRLNRQLLSSLNHSLTPN